MPRNDIATIHIKTLPSRRNCVLGKLRGRGTTMQAFMEDILAILESDDAAWELLEEKRRVLHAKREERSA